MGKAEAAEIVRSQIERITLTPGEDGGLEVELYGDLARILQLCEAGERTHKRPRTNVPGRHALGRLSVVAGARIHLYRTYIEWVPPYRRAFLTAERTCQEAGPDRPLFTLSCRTRAQPPGSLF